MPLPDDFDEFEFLQGTVLREHNKAVRNFFSEQEDNDLTTPKSALKHACLIKDNDTQPMMLQRQWLFEITIGNAQAVQAPIYGIPVQEYQIDKKFKPQVHLHFLEKFDSGTHDGKDPIPLMEGTIKFTLMNETSESIIETEAERLARKIKSEFATPPYEWRKGWYKCTYLDLERGYDLRPLVKSKAEGEKLIKSVLSIQGHTFDRDYFQFVEHDRTYSVNPGTHRVYGETVKKYIRRRKTDVYFRYAKLHIWGRPNAINLVALEGTKLRSVLELV
jgi:hypothetical protein